MADEKITGLSEADKTQGGVIPVVQGEDTKMVDIGTAAYHNEGVNEGEIPSVQADGKLPAAVLSATGATDDQAADIAANNIKRTYPPADQDKLASIEAGATAPSLGFQVADGEATDAWQSRDQSNWNALSGFHNDDEINEVAGKMQWQALGDGRYILQVAREAEYLSNTGRGKADNWLSQWKRDTYVALLPIPGLNFHGDDGQDAIFKVLSDAQLTESTLTIPNNPTRWEDTYWAEVQLVGDAPDWLTTINNQNTFHLKQTHAPLIEEVEVFPEGDAGDLLVKSDEGVAFQHPAIKVADTIPIGTNNVITEIKWGADGTCVMGTEVADGTRVIGISGLHGEAGNELGGFSTPESADFRVGDTDYKVGLLTWTSGNVDGQVELGVHPDDEGDLFEANGRLAIGRGTNVWFDIAISDAITEGTGGHKRLRWTGIDTGNAPTTASAVNSDPSFSAFIYCGEIANEFPPSINSVAERVAQELSKLRGLKRIDREAVSGNLATHTIFEQKEPMEVGRYQVAGVNQLTWGYGNFPSFTFGTADEDDLKFPFRNGAGNIAEITVKVLSWQVGQGGAYNAFLAFEPDVDSEIVGDRLIRLKIQHRTSESTEWMDVDDFSLFGFSHTQAALPGLDLIIINRSQEIIETYPQSGHMRFALYSAETPTPWKLLPHQNAEISDEDISDLTTSSVIGVSGRKIKKYVDDNTYPEADKTKLAGIEDDATADQSATEIRDSLEGLSGDERLQVSAIGGVSGVVEGAGYSETLIGSTGPFTFTGGEAFSATHDLTATGWQDYHMITLVIQPSFAPQGEGTIVFQMPTIGLKVLNNTADTTTSTDDVPAVSNIFTLGYNKTAKYQLAPKRKSGQTDAAVHDENTLRFAVETNEPAGITLARVYGQKFNVSGASSFSRSLIGDNTSVSLNTGLPTQITATGWQDYDNLLIEVCYATTHYGIANIAPALLAEKTGRLFGAPWIESASTVYVSFFRHYSVANVIQPNQITMGIAARTTLLKTINGATVKVWGEKY